MIPLSPQPSRRWFDDAMASLADIPSRIGAAVAAWRERALTQREFDQLAACGQLERTLADVGLAPCHVPIVIKQGRAARQHLDRMLARVGMPREPLPPSVSMREMAWRCTLCEQRRRCDDWLASGTSDDGFHAFCPNAGDLDLVRARKARGRAAGKVAA